MLYMPKVFFLIVIALLIVIFITINNVSAGDSDNYEYITELDLYLDDFIALSSYYSWLDSNRYRLIYKYSKVHDVSPKLVCAVINVESSGKNVISRKNSNGTRDYGIMQINDTHLESSFFESKNDLLDVEKNIAFGCRYLGLCSVKATKNNVVSYTDVIRLYNQGINGNREYYKNYNYVLKVYNNYIETL